MAIHNISPQKINASFFTFKRISQSNPAKSIDQPINVLCGQLTNQMKRKEERWWWSGAGVS